jgi:DNA polymerase I-like protein with 3'-5' exonuclease and polymerase domains
MVAKLQSRKHHQVHLSSRKETRRTSTRRLKESTLVSARRNKVSRKSTATSTRIVAVDTETTGLDLFHNSRPFLVSTLTEEGVARIWRWDVDPETRVVKVIPSQLQELKAYLQGAIIIFHNAIFDLRALSTIGVRFKFPGFTVPVLHNQKRVVIECSEFHDTSIMSHAFNNLGCMGDTPHALKPLALQYLDIPESDRDELHEAAHRARQLVRYRKMPWTVGRNLKGESKVAYDYWLPRAFWNLTKKQRARFRVTEDIPRSWRQVCAKYAVQDVVRTLGLYFFFQESLVEQGLWDVYRREMDLLPTTYLMEHAGMYCEPQRLTRVLNSFSLQALEHATKAEQLFGIENANSGDQIVTCLKKAGLATSKITASGSPSTNADALRDLAQYLEHKPKCSARHKQIAEALREMVGFDPDKDDPGEQKIPGYRTFTSGERYLKGYYDLLDHQDFLHPSFNQIGTNWTRFSCSNPNTQNVSSKSVLPLRSVFGPPPGYIWVAIDYSQIELRLYAYASKDKALIRSFEQGHDFHMTVACAIYSLPPEKITKEMRRIAKNTNFAIIYGASPRKIDATSGRPGTFAQFTKQFPNAGLFMQQIIDDVNRTGYITTLDGYRLHVPPNEPYKGLNGKIQGTAGRIVKQAMADVVAAELIDFKPGGSAIVGNIHDEIVYQFPLSYPWQALTRRIIRVMENCGTRLDVVTPVDASVVRENWAASQPFSTKRAA